MSSSTINRVRDVYLVRHARTKWNEEGRFQGRLDSPVTKVGKAQIEAVAQRLSAPAIDVVYTSDQGRSVLTADRIARAVHAPVVVDLRLRERSFGIFEGLEHTAAAERYPELVAKARITNDPDYTVPGGENRRAVHDRVMAAMIDALAYPGDGDVVVIGHGSSIRVFLNTVTGQSLPSANNKVPRNCSISLIHYDHGNWSAKVIGDDSHLPVLA